jgi:DnaJ-class molecular chaperone
MDFKDYYATLGVAKTATDKEIKQAFRKLARKHHPDVNPGDKSAESRFKEINEAYEVLGDPAKRKKYDELGSNWRLYEQNPGAASWGGPQDGGPFGGGTAGTGGFRTMTPEEMREMFGDDSDPFSDFFHAFFGGGAARAEGRGGRAGRKTPRKGRDFEDEIQLDLEDAYRGATRRLTIKQDGHARSVDVRIPPGVGEGSRVRIPGEGEHGSTGAQAGDLYLRIRLTPHAQFERKGSDLYTRVAVPLTTAVLGGEVDVPALSGKALRLKVPTTTQSGQVFRLKGHGMPVVGKPDDRGDLYATAEVQLPKQLTAEERTHYEALRRLAETKKSSVA